MIIKHLKIEKQEYNFVKSEDMLENLSKINIFIGTNNSGKSRFMRTLFYMNNNKLNFIPNEEKYNYFMKQTSKFKEFIDENRNKTFTHNKADALNNFVKIKNDLYRIVRINGNGTIRLISENEVLTALYGDYNNYMDSGVKTVVEEWFKQKFNNENYLTTGDFDVTNYNDYDIICIVVD